MKETFHLKKVNPVPCKSQMEIKTTNFIADAVHPAYCLNFVKFFERISLNLIPELRNTITALLS